MTVAHHHRPYRPELEAEVERLAKDRAVRDYLKRPSAEDFSHRIPLTGGSSKDGRTYYVDPTVPHKYRPLVLWHERLEKALRSVIGMSYDRAHDLATVSERYAAKEHGIDWDEYKRDIAVIVRKNEKLPRDELPAGFDTEPMRASERGEMSAIVEWFRSIAEIAAREHKNGNQEIANILDWAAAEIERLWHENEQLNRENVRLLGAYENLEAHNIKLDREIERLEERICLLEEPEVS